MRRYETIVISDPDMTDDERKGFFEHIKNLIPQHRGALIEFDEWGDRRLAYNIKKKGRGYYVRIHFGGDGALVAEMERQFRIDERVMKYMTVLLEKESDIQLLQRQPVEMESDDDSSDRDTFDDADDDLADNDVGDNDDVGDDDDLADNDIGTDDDFDDDDFDDDDFDDKSYI